jgi:hypothetical protein
VGAEVKLDRSWIDSKRVEPLLRYELAGFDLDVEVGHVLEFARLPAGTPVLRVAQRLRPFRPRVLKVIREAPSGEFLPDVLSAGDNVYLDGFWQSEDYFNDHAQLIRHDFAFRDSLSGTAAAFERAIGRESSVSVHVRRGDYVGSTFMYALDRQHYERAIGIIAREVGSVSIFVFSDEPDWCEANLRFDHPTAVVRYEDGADHSLDDLRLMSTCDHHVVANSSFSWWGAWLNPQPGKIVVAPRRWFSSPELRSEERRTPPDWIRI